MRELEIQIVKFITAVIDYNSELREAVSQKQMIQLHSTMYFSQLKNTEQFLVINFQFSQARTLNFLPEKFSLLLHFLL